MPEERPSSLFSFSEFWARGRESILEESKESENRSVLPPSVAWVRSQHSLAAGVVQEQWSRNNCTEYLDRPPNFPDLRVEQMRLRRSHVAEQGEGTAGRARSAEALGLGKGGGGSDLNETGLE